MQPIVTAIKRRADFVSASKSGFKFVKPSLVVQSRLRKEDENIQGVERSCVRIGFTATKTLGNAVIRNRTKRRMRAAAAKLVPQWGMSQCDYVFIGRSQAFKGPYDDLIRDMKHALKRLAELMKESD